MMQDSSSRALAGRHAWWLAATLGAVFVGCATGVEVTDGELAEICSEPGTTCGGVSSAGNTGSSFAGNNAVGSAGASNVGGSPGGGGGIGVGSGGRPASSGGSGQAGSGVGASGSAGTGGSAPQPLADGECLPQSDVVILYRDRSNGASSTSEPTMVLSVQNAGPAFDLSDLTIRYWFTADGGDNFSGNIDYAAFDGQQNLTGSVQVAFGQEFGSNYAELSFSQTGSVGSAGVREVQLRFHANNYPDLDQTNDFSFLSGATAATANPNITPYVNGSQVGGCVPAL